MTIEIGLITDSFLQDTENSPSTQGEKTGIEKIEIIAIYADYRHKYPALLSETQDIYPGPMSVKINSFNFRKICYLVRLGMTHNNKEVLHL